MIKRLALLLLVACCGLWVAPSAHAVMQIKKASAVKEQKQEAVEATLGGNLLGTALNLATGFMTMKKQQEALDIECRPSSNEIIFVNKMMMEYAKTGKETSAKFLEKTQAKGSAACSQAAALQAAGTDLAICYPAFDNSNAKDKVWNGYPMAYVDSKCPPENTQCNPKDKEYYSNIWDLYGNMGWLNTDLLDSELSEHTRLAEKLEKCDPAIIARKKKEMTMDLVTGTVGSIGQKQNAASTMDQVGVLMQSIGSSGGTGEMLQGIGTMGMPMLQGILQQ